MSTAAFKTPRTPEQPVIRANRLSDAKPQPGLQYPSIPLADEESVYSEATMLEVERILDLIVDVSRSLPRDTALQGPLNVAYRDILEVINRRMAKGAY